jgi:hypothetical protein
MCQADSKNVPYHALYLDSSGTPGWPPPWGVDTSAYFVLAGLALNPEADRDAHSSVPQLLTKYLGSRKPELHYGAIINKRPPYDKLSGKDREALSDEVFELILKLKPILFASVINKKRMKERYQKKAWPIRSYAVTSIVHRFAITLTRLGSLGHVVMDSETYRTDKELQSLVHAGRRAGMTIRGVLYEPAKESYLEPLLNSLVFSPSEMSPGIQLCDFVAYATWSKFERGKDQRFKQLLSLWDRRGNRKYEPCELPQKKP